MVNDEDLNERLKRLEERYKALESEADLLAEQAEDSHLLGYISEVINESDSIDQIIANALERISLLKNIPFCASGILETGGEFRILHSYSSFTIEKPAADMIAFPESFARTALIGTALAAGDQCSSLRIDALFSPGVFSPSSVLTVPLRARQGSGRLLLFADEDKSDKLENMSGLLLRLSDLIASKEENLHLFRELQVLNRELEQKVQSRTRELVQTNTDLQSEIDRRQEFEVELKRSEEQFRKLFQEFRTLLDAIPDTIMLLSPELKVLWANKPGMERWGKTRGANAQMHCYTAWHDAMTPCKACPAERCFRSGKPEEGLIQPPDGSVWDIRTVPIFDDDRNISSVIELCRDITQQRRLEEQLRHSQKMESIGTLAGGIAHDFNNILSAIIGYGHIVLMKMQEDDPQRQNIQHMLDASDRAAHLTKDILLFSRKQISNKKTVDANAVIRMTEHFLKRVIGEDITFRTLLLDNPIPVLIDPHQIEQVLMNLAINARDAMPNGGSLSISTEIIRVDDAFFTMHGYGKPGLYAMISVSDTGSGMDAATQQRIFEPFFTTKEVGKGTGLGLAVVYGIIEQHDGYINLYSEQGVGSTFKIYLPIAETDKFECELSKEMKFPLGGTETILLAEDDDTVRDLIVMVLRGQGYSVIEAVDGEDAVAKFIANRDRIQLLLFDLIMPKKNGKEAYDTIKNISAGIRVIFTSGYAPDIVHQRLLLEGDAPIIYKPISPTDLLHRVRETLDR